MIIIVWLFNYLFYYYLVSVWYHYSHLLCYNCMLYLSYHFVCMHVYFVFSLFSGLFSFVDFPSVLWYCWLGLLTCKNRLPYNLYCVGGDVKHCTIQPTCGATGTKLNSPQLRAVLHDLCLSILFSIGLGAGWSQTWKTRRFLWMQRTLGNIRDFCAT